MAADGLFSCFSTQSRIEINTIDDYTLFQSEFIDKQLIQKGILSSSPYKLRARRNEIHSVLLRLFFNPNEELCSVINQYISLFGHSYVIGLQLRMGGKMRNRIDTKVFQNMTDVEHIVKTVMAKIDSLSKTQCVVFLSTDSMSVQSYVMDFFHLRIPVIVVNHYLIGHSASVHSGNKVEWIQATKRAIVDLLLLKESDNLVTTKGSSFGDFAKDFKNSYNMGVSVESFLRERGLTCSVFHKKQRMHCVVCGKTRRGVVPSLLSRLNFMMKQSKG